MRSHSKKNKTIKLLSLVYMAPKTFHVHSIQWILQVVEKGGSN